MAMYARASAARPSSTPTALRRRMNAAAPQRPATKRRRFRSSSASLFLTWRNARACPRISRRSRRRLKQDLILPQAEALIRATGVDFRIGGDRAFYDPMHDFVQVPPPQAYFEPINWHRTALHEVGHASGHHSRLNRDLTGSFGSKKYAFEELIAEISAAYLCASLRITPTVRHADYIASWLELLREDDRAIVRAASAASKAADFILGFQPDVPKPVAATSEDDEREAA